MDLPIFKSGINGKAAYSRRLWACRIFLIFKYPYHTVYSFRKGVWGKYLTHIFGFSSFSLLLGNSLLNLPRPIYLNKVMAFGIVKFLIFARSLIIFDFSRKLQAKSEILGSIHRTVCEKLPCIQLRPNFLIFDRFTFFLVFSKSALPILRFGVQSKKWFCGNSHALSTTPIFLLKRYGPRNSQL